MDSLADSEVYIKVFLRNICCIKKKSKALHAKMYKFKEKNNCKSKINVFKDKMMKILLIARITSRWTVQNQ